MSILGVIYRNWKQQGINEPNYFMYQWVAPQWTPPLRAPVSELILYTAPHQ